MRPHLHNDGMNIRGVIETEGGRLLKVKAHRQGRSGVRKVNGAMTVDTASEAAVCTVKGCPFAEPAEASA